MKPAYVPNPGDLVVITRLPKIQASDGLFAPPGVGSVVVAARDCQNGWVPYRCNAPQRRLNGGGICDYAARSNEGGWCMLFANPIEEAEAEALFSFVCCCRPVDPAVEAAWRLKAR